MKLQQVLLNVLSNAIKFTGEGGKVTFSAAQRHRTKNDAVLRFVVNDTGAVSYTHLDVYKRQRQWLRIQTGRFLTKKRPRPG